MGEWIAAASGILLVVAVFLPWYRVAGHDVTGWQAMTVDDVLLTIAGIGAVAAAVATAARPGTSVPVAYTALATIGGIAATILAAWRLVDPAAPADAGLAIGAWLGLAGAVGVAAGSWAGMADEGPARRRRDAEAAAAEAGRRRAEFISLPADPGAGS